VNTAVIFLAGEIKDYSVIKKYTEQADFVICADGGTRHADYMNVIPDMIIGDMDSIDPDLLGKYIGKGVKTRLFKTEKDETDSQLAVDIAFEQGFKDIVLLGAFGCSFRSADLRWILAALFPLRHIPALLYGHRFETCIARSKA
jgi:thiamine pyrophosphokinase